MTLPRPLIAIPARFAASASALRYGAEVSARALVEAVWRAGGEPVTIHPYAPGGFAYAADVAARLTRFDGVLLPGGDDLPPHLYEKEHDWRTRAPGMDDEQDGFDLEVARQALRLGRPLLAVCRGLQIVNTVLGGTLRHGVDGPEREHRHLVHPVTLRPGSRIARITGGEKAEVSCYHRLRVDRLGEGLRITARAADGTPEALELVGAKGWLTAVQWHPEDTAHEDPTQQRIFDALIKVATP
ncbi:gamma-glutamyl-gamma-aminobutyrate hydrolase family protein [Streptomyces albipurpureus]|uniref:Gamma-glutamyl-gamma-aminobutyrate hydrolase family protein n=1 Tax=Streptomyces albipurpureus TaxID=2897419 RepID=A0ABT0UII1_9ACTN|nr:gamma-glutamyl-gamma-aminobutyrate hydrolase family protein [Streptomyces sp. CWNU-1]MCM2387116.1 gamma-glutamyl-gamma-aminobutyrate hydrolase family protein [Streptomyces sp. CWNU-1]